MGFFASLHNLILRVIGLFKSPSPNISYNNRDASLANTTNYKSSPLLKGQFRFYCRWTLCIPELLWSTLSWGRSATTNKEKEINNRPMWWKAFLSHVFVIKHQLGSLLHFVMQITLDQSNCTYPIRNPLTHIITAPGTNQMLTGLSSPQTSHTHTHNWKNIYIEGT